MKITYDGEVDAMYIQLIEGKHQCRTVRLNDEIALDFGIGEKLVGIEILDARKTLGKGKLPQIVLDNIAVANVPASRRARKSRVRGASRSGKSKRTAA
jgi:uncharacterized protein YuzE